MERETKQIVIAGAGLAGLAAAATAARAGARVLLLDEKSPGGRARTDEQDGFRFNRGPHAIQLRGPSRQLLARLGVEPATHKPPARGSRLLLDGQLHPLLSRRILGVRSAAQLAVVFRSIFRESGWPAVPSTREWIESRELTPKAAALLEVFVRVSTYTVDLDALPADVAIGQLRGSAHGVGYPDEGWQYLVDGLLRTATEAGAEFRAHSQVTAIDGEPGAWRVQTRQGDEIRAAAVVVATGTPTGARKLLPNGFGPGAADWDGLGPKVTAACLDLGVRHTRARPTIGVDEPLYLSPHAPAGNLAPTGRGMVHVARYGATAPSADRSRLEEFAAMAGIPAGDIASSRFLPNMTVVSAMPALGTGLKGRPPVTVDGAAGLFVAGDWVGPTGWLSDGPLASGEKAGQLAAESVASDTRPSRMAAATRSPSGPPHVS